MKIDWTPLTVTTQDDLLKAAKTDIWFVVCENIAGVTHLRISAQGAWSPPAASPVEFDPNGGALQSLPLTLPELAHAPFAALVGKIGGASAGVMPLPASGVTSPPPPPPWPPQLDQPFLVGKSCTLALPAGTIGPLYLGFNCLARPIKLAKLEVTVEGATPFVSK